jgi:hypothetical protein
MQMRQVAASSSLAALFILSVSLSACGDRASQGTPSASFSPSSPKPLILVVTTTPLAHGARLTGRTNLPDGTELMTSLGRYSVLAGDKVSVVGGGFTQDLFPNDGKPIPPGDYDVEVSSPLGDIQPTAVKAQLGSEYESLTGPLVVKGEIGRIIDYQSKIRSEGPPSPAADRAARKKAYRDHVALSERLCRSNPDTVEGLTGVPLSPQRRSEIVRRCLAGMATSRKELGAEGLVEAN